MGGTRGAERTTDDVAGALRRQVASLARRANAGDDEALTALVEITGISRRLVGEAIIDAHIGSGRWTYGELGRILGVSRQAVRQRAMRAAR